MTSKRLNQDTQNKYKVISALALMTKPTVFDISNITDISEPTVKRQIALLRKEYLMDVRYIRESNGKQGKSGYYELVSWGIINRTEFLKKFGGQSYVS